MQEDILVERAKLKCIVVKFPRKTTLSVNIKGLEDAKVSMPLLAINDVE